MNGIAGQFPLRRAQVFWRIIEEIGAAGERQLKASAGMSFERKTLSGYGLAMRRHAAAYEAVR